MAVEDWPPAIDELPNAVPAALVDLVLTPIATDPNAEASVLLPAAKDTAPVALAFLPMAAEQSPEADDDEPAAMEYSPVAWVE
jgi:hypothetical protein